MFFFFGKALICIGVESQVSVEKCSAVCDINKHGMKTNNQRNGFKGQILYIPNFGKTITFLFV